MNKDKVLVLKDLSSRLPYSPIVHIIDEDGTEVDALLTTSTIDNLGKWVVKPYLRPISSMTDKELEEAKQLYDFRFADRKVYITVSKFMDFLNKHHFDYNGLLQLGLAIEAPSGMYKEE